MQQYHLKTFSKMTSDCTDECYMSARRLCSIFFCVFSCRIHYLVTNAEAEQIKKYLFAMPVEQFLFIP